MYVRLNWLLIKWLCAWVWLIDRSNGLVVWLIDFLADKSIDWVDWLESLFDWLKLRLLNKCWFDKFSMDWLNKCLNDLLIGRGIDGLIDLIIDLYLCGLIVCLVELLVVWRIDELFVWLIDELIKCLRYEKCRIFHNLQLIDLCVD